jgi:hypothetical protein
MSKRWMVGIGVLLSCLLTQTAAAQQGGQAEDRKVEEAKAAAGKAAADKKTAGDESSKKQAKAKGIPEEPLVDSYGKPVMVRQQLIDSRGKEIPFTDVPLRETLVCYPPPRGPHPAQEASLHGTPKDYVCSRVHAEPTQVLRVLNMSCPPGYKPCVIPNYPSYVGCCPL